MSPRSLTIVVATAAIAGLTAGSGAGCFFRDHCHRDAECAADLVCYPDHRCLPRDVARRAGATVGDECANDDLACVAPGYCVTGFCVNEPSRDDAGTDERPPDSPPLFTGVAGVAPDGDGTLIVWWPAPIDDRTQWSEVEVLVLRGDSPGFDAPLPLAVVKGELYFRDRFLENGKRYHYRAVARDNANMLDANTSERSAVPEPPPEVAPGVDYASVQAIFTAHCTHCHGGASNLFLESYDQLLEGGARGPVGVPCEPDRSTLAAKLHSDPPFGLRMPRDGPPFLTPLQSATIRRWIADGARMTPTPGVCP